MIAAIYVRTTIVMLCCLLAVATQSASAQTDECGRMRYVRREAENQMMLLLTSLLMTPAEQIAAAARMGMDNRYDPVPAAQARRQCQVQQAQQIIALAKQRELEACSDSAPTAPSPSERQPRPSEGGQLGAPPAPARKDGTACPFGAYWHIVRQQCVKIGE
jgi:hypothetical protein